MKKFVIGVLCCVGLILAFTSGAENAQDAKPEITSINKFV